MLALFNTQSSILIRSVPTDGQVDHVPAHVYTVGVDKQGIVLNKSRARFEVPSKTYGEHVFHRTLVTDDFMDTTGSLGLILSGLKGSGKSMLAEDIANSLLSRDIPVLMITEALPMELLLNVIQIVGPCMVYFDEFGKVYEEPQRAALLPLFSDSSLKKVLFVVTSNDTNELNDNMLNRPGRFKYAIGYHDLEKEVVDEMLAEYNLAQPIQEMLRAYVKKYRLSIDMFQQVLKAAGKAVDLPALVKRMRILNVPSPMVRTYSVEEVYYQNERFFGDAVVIRNGDEIEVEFYQKGSTDLFAGGLIDFNTSKLVMLREDGSDQVFRVTVTDELVVQIKRGWSVESLAPAQGVALKGELSEKKTTSPHEYMMPGFMDSFRPKQGVSV